MEPSMTHNQSRNYLPPLDTPHRGTHGSSMDRGKTLCPQQLAQPRTTRDHQQGNGRKLSLTLTCSQRRPRTSRSSLVS